MKPVALVVDDSLTVRMDLRETLAEAGFATEVAETLAAARAILAAQRVAVLILDVRLPDGDGIELLTEVRSNPATASLGVILLSTEAEVRDRVRGLSTGADEYLGKPYDPEVLVERTRQLARRHVVREPEDDTRPILLIDDSPTFREMLGAALEAAGYPIAFATNGKSGLRAASELAPRAVIVDGMMPDIDGVTVVKRLRFDPALRSLPVVMLTGSDAAADELASLEAGADAYVRKAEEMSTILTRIAAVLRRAPPPRERPRASSARRLLVIDDSPTYREELQAALEANGYVVAAASSGKAGLELLATSPVDAILLDLHMPELDGHETCRRIKSSPAWRDLPLLVVTSADDREAMVAAINAGADDYILKSASFDVLFARLRAQLRRRQFEDEHRILRDELLQRELEASRARASQALAEARAELLQDLAEKNALLEETNLELATAKERAERESEFKSKFLANMSHELRTPLNAIIGFSELLMLHDFGPLTETQREFVEHVVGGGRHLLALVNDILDIAKIEAGKLELRLERMALPEALDEVRASVEQLASKQGVAIELDLPAGLPEVTIDPLRIRQVVFNLMSNAIKFTARGGRVRLVASRQDDALQICVEDNGIGIDAKDLSRLFGEFVQLGASPHAGQTGTGLGLALTRKLVELHGGTIAAASEKGKGTTMTVRLPLAV